MSIRGLVFDDPHGTQGIELSAMEFQTYNRTIRTADENNLRDVVSESECCGHCGVAKNV